jgi:riboflavin kinase/FMN adenylyltransferase
MQAYRRLPPRALRVPCALTIGNFDGVHLGHQAILARLREAASSRSLPTCVMTFEPHPREFFAAHGKGRAPARISTLRDKLDALALYGVDRVNICHFNANFANLSAEAFIDEILVDGLRVSFLLVGDDFRFGAGRRGDFDMLAEHARAKGFEIAAMPTVTDAHGRISSSSVRDALARGDLVRAEALLGRPYTIAGHVIHGRKLGRDLGFPTLNLRMPAAIPALTGIYAVRVRGLDDRPLDAVASLGTRPAVERDGHMLLEVHVFDFDAQVYGRLVHVDFIQKLRDEANFASLDALKNQIAADARAARTILLSGRTG